MAVSVQVPFYSRLDMWGMGDPPTSLSSTDSDALPTMAYQYPLGTSGLESNMIPSYPSLLGERTQPESPADAKSSSPSLQNIHGTSTGSKSAKIKRSMSTPNVRGQSSADAAALALSAEKRRNKLGYHRTSVACGHCRRRKIRCIPAPGDVQKRCSNCIRLKKECNFYPVDQQPPPEPRRRGSKGQSGTGRASGSSSPSTTSGQPPELPPTLPFHPLSMPPIQDLGGPSMKKPRTASFSSENKVVTSSSNYDYGHGATNWMPHDASPSTSSKPQEMPPSYWRVSHQDPPLTSGFPPFTSGLHIPPPQNWAPPSQTEPSQRDELTWPVPQRSISYGNIEGLQSHPQYSAYPHPYPQASPIPDHYSTKPRSMQSGMYPLPISLSSSVIPPPETVTSSDAPPQAHYLNWQQQSYPYPKPTSEPYGGAWSSSHGGQPHVPEEAHAPPAGYGYGEPSGGMFYPPPPHRR